jgi:hypothetical protein
MNLLLLLPLAFPFVCLASVKTRGAGWLRDPSRSRLEKGR